MTDVLNPSKAQIDDSLGDDWGARKAAIEAGDTIVITHKNDDRRREARRKKNRGQALQHAQSRDRYDRERGFIRPGATPSEDKLRREWESEEERGTTREEFAADVENELEARELARREAAVKAEADKREQEAYTSARMRAHGLDDENSPPKVLP
jgi:hypothetical protein